MAERTSPSEGGGLTDALRRYVDAVTGFTEVPRERAERIMSDLAKRGESRARDLQKSARALADRSARNRSDLVRLVQKEIRRQMESRGYATRDEVSRLRSRVEELEKEAAGSARRTRKPSAAKSGASRKSGSSKKASARKRSGAAKKSTGH